MQRAIWRCRVRAPSRTSPNLGFTHLVEVTISSLLVFLLLPLFGGDAGGVARFRADQLPKAAHTVPLDGRGPIVVVARDGLLRLDGDLIDGAGLNDRLAEIRTANERIVTELGIGRRPFDGQVFVAGDAGADARAVQQVISVAQDGGWRIALIVRQP